jgi:hypothetical protein
MIDSARHAHRTINERRRDRTDSRTDGMHRSDVEEGEGVSSDILFLVTYLLRSFEAGSKHLALLHQHFRV